MPGRVLNFNLTANCIEPFFNCWLKLESVRSTGFLPLKDLKTLVIAPSFKIQLFWGWHSHCRWNRSGPKVTLYVIKRPIPKNIFVDSTLGFDLLNNNRLDLALEYLRNISQHCISNYPMFQSKCVAGVGILKYCLLAQRTWMCSLVNN